MADEEDYSEFGRFVESLCVGATYELSRMFTVDRVYLQQQFSF